MPDTGWVDFTTFASVTPGTTAWSNPSNAQSDDATYTNGSLAAIGQTSEYLRCTVLHSSGWPPLGSTPVGIEIRVKRVMVASGSSQIWDSTVKLYLSGSIVGSNKNASGTWPTSIAYKTYGGPTDLWGLTPTRAQLMGGGFVFKCVQLIASGTPAFSVDHAQIKIYYDILEATPSPVTFSFDIAAPSVSCDKSVTPSPVAFNLSPVSTSTKVDKAATPSSVAMGFSVASPSVAIDKSVSPSPIAFAFTAASPTITSSGEVKPDPTAFSITVVAPSIAVDKPATPSPTAFQFLVASPTITARKTATPSATAFAFSIVAPYVDINYSVQPDSVVFSLSTASPSVALDKSASPDALPFGFLPVAATATPSKSIAPSPATFSFLPVTPTVTSGGNAAPNPATFSITVASPAASVDKTASPNAAVFQFAIAAASISALKTASPSSVAFGFALSTPSLAVNKTATPLPVGFAFTVMNPAITIGPTVDAGRHIDTIIDLDYTMRPTVLEGGAAITTYLWEVVSEPMGATVTFSATDVEAPTVSFDTVGDYTLRLTVTDANGNDGDDTVTATVYLSLGGDPLYRSLPRKFV